MAKKKKRKKAKPAANSYTESSDSPLVQTKVYFQREVLRKMRALVGQAQLENPQYSQSIFIERAVQRELQRVRKASNLKPSERARS